MTEQTFSLAEVAAEHLPKEWKNPTRWLAERLNRGELRGVRFGRTWRMRTRDIDYMLNRYSNDGRAIDRPKPAATEPPLSMACLSDRLRTAS
ncbi:hypothetical protein MMAR_3939 [Mycobacterium marinum M]|uniref:Helix-turn-helix domain-containing protein n=1 Tax=Mycobacterium marinum (strain ATCC BAA-535 / M) TaxID=216594 RepID=B2HPJ5_MYCMM|nr:hypothetical protein [Mycobacterium marinum]ACC42347.1 hypothetical protein MMAR_3939 [Mycobacterium marinum M]